MDKDLSFGCKIGDVVGFQTAYMMQRWVGVVISIVDSERGRWFRLRVPKEPIANIPQNDYVSIFVSKGSHGH